MRARFMVPKSFKCPTWRLGSSPFLWERLSPTFQHKRTTSDSVHYNAGEIRKRALAWTLRWFGQALNRDHLMVHFQGDFKDHLLPFLLPDLAHFNKHSDKVGMTCHKTKGSVAFNLIKKKKKLNLTLKLTANLVNLSIRRRPTKNGSRNGFEVVNFMIMLCLLL